MAVRPYTGTRAPRWPKTHYHTCGTCGGQWPHNAGVPCGLAPKATCPPCNHRARNQEGATE